MGTLYNGYTFPEKPLEPGQGAWRLPPLRL